MERWTDGEIIETCLSPRTWSLAPAEPGLLLSPVVSKPVSAAPCRDLQIRRWVFSLVAAALRRRGAGIAAAHPPSAGARDRATGSDPAASAPPWAELRAGADLQIDKKNCI